MENEEVSYFSYTIGENRTLYPIYLSDYLPAPGTHFGCNSWPNHARSRRRAGLALASELP